jgi:DNA repair exonuclease SbcCD ATPase subunit
MDFFFGSSAPTPTTVIEKLSTPLNGGKTRTPLRDRSNLLISPFGLSPKPVKQNFSLEQDEDDGYHSAESDSVDDLLSGNWQPNYDLPLEDEEVVESTNQERESILMPTLMEPSQSVTITQNSAFKYTEEDVAAMKAQWMKEMHEERETAQKKQSAVETAFSELQEKEGQYLALITEYEATVTALEQEKKSRDDSNLEAYARQLSELEVANTRLRTERQELEGTFQQLHKRYEQLKTLQANAIKNETVLKQTLAKSQTDLMTAEARFLRLKTHAQTQLDAANAEINRIRDESVRKTLLLAAKLSLCQTQLASISVEFDLSKGENQTLQNIVSELCAQINPTSSQSAPEVSY